MANIDNYLANILSAVYGETVRHSIHDAIKAMNGEEIRTSRAIASLEEELSEYENIFTGNLDESVSNWLDDHPEATTTVEDGAITFPKMGIGMNNSQTVKNIAELKTSTAPYVYVINNDSRVCDINNMYVSGGYESTEEFSVNRGGCWYWTHKNNIGGTERSEIYGGYLRENGDVMFAMPDQGERTSLSNEAISSVLDTFASYFSDNSLVYGQTGTLFMRDCVPNTGEQDTRRNGKYNIDCTSFVSAIIQGIRKEDSRYVRGDAANNIRTRYGNMTLPSTRGKNLLYLNELVEYFAENKQLFTLHKGIDVYNTVAINGLQPGDILFSCSPEATGDERNRWRSYYAVDHAVVVLQTYPEEGLILIGESGGSGASDFAHSVLYNSKFGWLDGTVESWPLSVVKVNLINFWDYVGIKYKVFARPIYGKARNAVNISGRFISGGVVTHTAASQSLYMGSIIPTKSMKAGKAYSVSIKGKLPKYDTEGVYLLAVISYINNNGNEASISYDIGYKYEGDGTYFSFPLFIPQSDEIKQITAVNIRANNLDGTTGNSYWIDEIALYDGISYYADGSSLLTFTKDSNFPNDVQNMSYCDGERNYIILRFNATGVSMQEITVGKFSNFRTQINGSIIVPITISGVDAGVCTITQDGTVKYVARPTSTGLCVVYVTT